MKLRVPYVTATATSGLARVEVKYNAGKGMTLPEATRLAEAIRNIDTLLDLSRAYCEVVPLSKDNHKAYRMIRHLVAPIPPTPTFRATVRARG